MAGPLPARVLRPTGKPSLKLGGLLQEGSPPPVLGLGHPIFSVYVDNGTVIGFNERDAEDGHVYGLVNVAAFLAQSMKETIQYDACDENSWDLVGGKYPLSK